MINYCLLGLGSNLNSPARQLRNAILALQKLPRSSLLKIAKFYPNKAWGRKVQPKFFNTVVLIKTTLKPDKLLTLCNKIEKKQGRVRQVICGSRTLDIDILLFGTLNLKSPKLIVPHPRMHQRDFVLMPLLDIISP